MIGVVSKDGGDADQVAKGHEAEDEAQAWVRVHPEALAPTDGAEHPPGVLRGRGA